MARTTDILFRAGMEHNQAMQGFNVLSRGMDKINTQTSRLSRNSNQAHRNFQQMSRGGGILGALGISGGGMGALNRLLGVTLPGLFAGLSLANLGREGVREMGD